MLDMPYSRTYEISSGDIPEIELTAPVYNDRLPVTASRTELNAQEISDLMTLLHFRGYEFDDPKRQDVEITGYKVVLPQCTKRCVY